MSATSAAALVARYSRIPAAVEAVRAITLELDGLVEFVLLEPARALVMAAIGPATLQPRALHTVESQLQGDVPIACSETHTSVRVQLPDGQVGALTIDKPILETQKQYMLDLARALSASLEYAVSDTNAVESRDAQILNGIRDTIILLDADLTVTWANNSVATLLGWSPEEIVGRAAIDLVHHEDVAHTLDAAVRLSEANRVYRIHVRLRDVFENWIPVSVTGLDHSTNPEIGGLLLTLRDDELEVQHKRELEQSRRISSTILQSLNEAVVATDETGAITIVNDAARELFGIDASAPAPSLSIDDIALIDDNNSLLASDAHPLRGNGQWSGNELRVKTSYGLRHVQVSSSEVMLDNDRLGLVATFHDITRARSDARKLRNRALHDQLTGLANRRYLSERLQSFATAGSLPTLAACFIDIDKFKNVNDIHGHRVGDAVLRATAQRLRGQVRDGDILARPGGDEFLVILVNPECDHTAVEVAERIRAALAQPFDIEGIRLHLTASVGIAYENDGKLNDDRLLQHADIALYAAKDHGRDRVEVFDQELATVVELEQAQRNMVRTALDHNRLVMLFQPIVNHQGTTVGVEALARFKDPRGKIIEPSGFLHAIEGTKLMVRLDRSGFQQSCELAATLERQPSTSHVWVAANFSAMTLAQPDFAEVVMRTITDAGVSPSSICVEVTETAAFEAGEEGIAALAHLYNAGVRIALDDFGTGYSSLSHLRDLPLTTVKIDRSFTSELNRHGAERAIATAVKDLARSLGFGVVAEGVETAEDQQAVREIGVDTMQGWYFARAIPASQLLDELTIDSSRLRTNVRA